MKITFDTNNLEEVTEVATYLERLLTGAVVKLTDTVEEPETHVDEVETPEGMVEVTPEVKTAPEPTEEPKPKRKPKAKKPSISLQDLKDLAKDQVPVIGRTKVKEIISEYADKLTEVKESDYEALATALKA